VFAPPIVPPPSPDAPADELPDDVLLAPAPVPAVAVPFPPPTLPPPPLLLFDSLPGGSGCGFRKQPWATLAASGSTAYESATRRLDRESFMSPRKAESTLWTSLARLASPVYNAASMASLDGRDLAGTTASPQLREARRAPPQEGPG